MSAWRKYMKPVLIGGGTLAGIALLALAMTAGGCESRPFAKKAVRRPAAVAPRGEKKGETKKDVHRQELDELLSLE